MMDRQYTLHVLSHTHWDREWDQDFQGFRQRLVFQIDSLMDLLEQSPEYKCFHMDGQTVCLKDYLEIRPDSRDRLQRHLRNGRVLIGPWYAMPDELLLSGESLVRNLVLGHKICRDFGVESMPVGYVSDIFGHCSQFPQIMRGFGIDTVFLHRGTSNADGASEMLWEGADGSEVLIIKAYPHTGYNDFLAYREADENALLDYEEKKTSYANTHVLFALDGNDHAPAYRQTLGYISHLNDVFTDTRCIHSSMLDYLRELKAELGDFTKAGLIRHRGELRTPMKAGMYAEMFNGTASSRVNLKQRNDRLEYLLPRSAEFLHACSVRLGGDSQKPFLDLAWEYLIQNHPHDSIVGCSIDQVHRDMVYRFDQARLLASNSIAESVHAIGDRLDTASLGDSDAVLTVHNPSSVDLGPVVDVFFEMLSTIVEEKAKVGLAPALVDENGDTVYCEVTRTDMDMWPSPQVKKIHGDSPSFSRIQNAWLPHHRFHSAVAASVPALGYRSWRVRFVPRRAAVSVALPSGLWPVTVDAAAKVIENEWLKLRVREDGLVDILDKQTGVEFVGLHDLEDCGDTGQGWDHIYPESDTVVRASDPGARGRVSTRVERIGSLTAKATISFSMRVPVGLTTDRKARTKRRVSVPATISLTVRAGSRRVDCETTILNTARCHRMRALFPTDRESDVWFGDTAFDLVQRDVKLPDTTGWHEQAREETPIKNFAAVQDSQAGLAVLTRGLCEACVQDDSQRTLALTLFRGFEEQIGDGWTQDSLLLGSITLNYSLVPLGSSASPLSLFLFQEAERYKLGAISLTSPAHSGDMQPSGRFLELPEGLVVSTIKLSEDSRSTVVRLFNPGVSEVVGRIRSCQPIQKAWRCDLMERNVEPLSVLNESSIDIRAAAKEVVTLRLV